jgi:predicted dehydrogenase/threonine dehydrogenase-like Zn-dependent dehydrogenase
MKQVLVQKGKVFVSEVPDPLVGGKNILVKLISSCISVGTEVANINASGMSIYRRILKHPQQIKKALTLISQHGVSSTLNQISRIVDAPAPIGYSAAGRIVAVGAQVEGFKVGDLVGCAGAGIANHAELIDVPVNLAVRIPCNLSVELASTVTLGAIAMQGVRRFSPNIGETVAVVGLGILGQITGQILIANGCRVIGIDTNPERVKIALSCGFEHGCEATDCNILDKIKIITDGFGVDGVIITAASSGDTVINDSMRYCRRKGKVVLVGDVGLNIKRQDFYQKEIDLYISCSYGPGRYDPVYEEHGQDYPLPYVRWTENRNMETYLRLLSRGNINLSPIPVERFSINDAPSAFNALCNDDRKPLLVYLSYPDHRTEENRSKNQRIVEPNLRSSKLRVALVGAGGFAHSVHLPNLAKLSDRFDLRAVVSKTGANAQHVAKQYGISYATTKYDEVLADESVDLVIICTRHNLHVPMVLAALKRGKHVLVEKPIAIERSGLKEIVGFFEAGGPSPILMTGFNRRFSPAIARVVGLTSKRCGPMMVNYRMNAGFLPKDHWVHGDEGGGRNIGEACHIYDLFNYMVGTMPTTISATSLTSRSKQWSSHDNFVVCIKYDDGSVCNLMYTAIGSRNHPKEMMEIFVDGQVISMADFKTVEVNGVCKSVWRYGLASKGQIEELVALSEAIIKGGKWPISIEEQILATDMSFQIEDKLFMFQDKVW